MVYVCVHMCAKAGEGYISSSVIFHLISLRQHHSLNMELVVFQLVYLANKPQWYSCFPTPHQHWGYRCVSEYLTWLLSGRWGSELRDLYLYSKCSYLLSYLPSRPSSSDCSNVVAYYVWALHGSCRLTWSTWFLALLMEPFSQTSLGTFWSSFTYVLLAHRGGVKPLGGSLQLFLLCLPY